MPLDTLNALPLPFSSLGGCLNDGLSRHIEGGGCGKTVLPFACEILPLQTKGVFPQRARRILNNEGPMDDMTSTVLEYVREEYLDDDDDLDVRPETPLITSGIVDSFSMASLKTFVEHKYAVAIPAAEATIEAFDTVRSIVALVRKHQPR